MHGLMHSSFSCSFFSIFRRCKYESLQCNPRMDGYRGPLTATEVMKWLLLLRLLEQCLKSWSTIIIDKPVIWKPLVEMLYLGDCFCCLLLQWSFSALFVGQGRHAIRGTALLGLWFTTCIYWYLHTQVFYLCFHKHVVVDELFSSSSVKTASGSCSFAYTIHK